jgi:hypothetical protein
MPARRMTILLVLACIDQKIARGFQKKDTNIGVRAVVVTLGSPVARVFKARASQLNTRSAAQRDDAQACAY